MPSTLFEAIQLAFESNASLVAEFEHDQSNGPHKFWRDVVDSGTDGGGGIPVPPPYVVASILGSGPSSFTFGRGFTRTVTVLIKTFALSVSEAERLGGLVSEAILNPSKGRPPLVWSGGREVVSQPTDDRTVTIPGRGVSGSQLYGHYARFAVTVSGRY